MASKGIVKVAAICGTLRKASFNRGLVRAAIELCKADVDGVEVEVLELSELPMLNTDLEVNGTFPPVVEAFRQKVRQADAFLFASGEYNYSVPAPLKNALDWASRPPNCWGDRAAAIVTAGGGSAGARSQYHLRQIGVFLDLHFINKPELFVQAFAQPPKFDFATGDVIDPQVVERLKAVVISLRDFARRLQTGKPENLS